MTTNPYEPPTMPVKELVDPERERISPSPDEDDLGGLLQIVRFFGVLGGVFGVLFVIAALLVSVLA